VAWTFDAAESGVAAAASAWLAALDDFAALARVVALA
jgi:hypothetical protein